MTTTPSAEQFYAILRPRTGPVNLPPAKSAG
jgi:hypothetical protein